MLSNMTKIQKGTIRIYQTKEKLWKSLLMVTKIFLKEEQKIQESNSLKSIRDNTGTLGLYEGFGKC